MRIYSCCCKSSFNNALTFFSIAGGEIVVKFLQVALGGPLWGFFTAKISLFCLSRVFNDALVEITITLASTYLTFYVGKSLSASPKSTYTYLLHLSPSSHLLIDYMFVLRYVENLSPLLMKPLLT
jgi:hypothetical protein